MHPPPPPLLHAQPRCGTPSHSGDSRAGACAKAPLQPHMAHPGNHTYFLWLLPCYCGTPHVEEARGPFLQGTTAGCATCLFNSQCTCTHPLRTGCLSLCPMCYDEHGAYSKGVQGTPPSLMTHAPPSYPLSWWPLCMSRHHSEGGGGLRLGRAQEPPPPPPPPCRLLFLI